jgi:four helix bundle protein
LGDQAFESYRDLRVWRESMTLAELCYRLTRSFPKEETFGLSSQIRRSAASVPANIAEGHGRENTRTFVQHLRIAQGSLKETETHFLLAQRVGLLPQTDTDAVMAQCETIGKMLRSLIRSMQKKAAES